MYIVIESFKDISMISKQIVERLNSQDGVLGAPVVIYKFETLPQAKNYVEVRLNDPNYNYLYSYDIIEGKRLAFLTQNIQKPQTILVDYTEIEIIQQ